MNFHLRMLILSEAPDGDGTIQKLRFVSREFYDMYASVLPYREPEWWDKLQAGRPVHSLIERFSRITEFKCNTLELKEIGSVLLQHELLEDALFVREKVRNHYLLNIIFLEKCFYHLISRLGRYDLAYAEMNYFCSTSRSTRIELASCLVDAFIIERYDDERTVPLITQIINRNRRITMLYSYKVRDLLQREINWPKFLSVLKPVESPLKLNQAALFCYIWFDRPDIAYQFAQHSESDYGGALDENEYMYLLNQKSKEFLRFSFETGICFKYNLSKEKLMYIFRNWSNFSHIQKLVARDMIQNNQRPERYEEVMQKIRVPWQEIDAFVNGS